MCRVFNSGGQVLERDSLYRPYDGGLPVPEQELRIDGGLATTDLAAPAHAGRIDHVLVAHDPARSLPLPQPESASANARSSRSSTPNLAAQSRR